eukprot:CAMPEP_0202867636 /NCGR_PEP_ID=MMETSP1391-20130828/9545_1 /ASSEMBLY_ACC=CAM_ASM_000867 /TAXON_ID=1034604 /ORGANISM="Chlamydomonas leiostraca, Strain SAG 11-49" /LENGTH=75 /DNA_ID=CAMNT_0049547695 /DNA_START=177 /DNA_END=405 /DNA_ORIENTATION=-
MKCATSCCMAYNHKMRNTDIKHHDHSSSYAIAPAAESPPSRLGLLLRALPDAEGGQRARAVAHHSEEGLKCHQEF